MLSIESDDQYTEHILSSPQSLVHLLFQSPSDLDQIHLPYESLNGKYNAHESQIQSIVQD